MPELALNKDLSSANEPMRRFDWRLSACGVVGALVILLPTWIFGSDIDGFFVSLFVVPVISLALLVAAARTVRRQTLAALSMLFIFVVLSLLLFKNSTEIRYASRWLFGSEDYKSMVLAEPVSALGDFRHMEWDGWGWAGSGNTTVYLVFDPGDALRTQTKLRSSGKFSGIPCKVPRIQRLEDHWYSVQFYADEAWGYCN